MTGKKRRVERAALLVIAAWSLPVTTLAQEKPGGTSPAEARIRLLVNGAYVATTRTFSEVTTFTEFLEPGSSRRDYEGGTGFVLEVGGIYSITSTIGVMGTFEVFDGDNDATFREIVPHPLFFDRDREVRGSETGLSYRENAVHLDAVYTRDISSFTVDLYGGPSLFITEMELLTDITTSSAYPFDELILERTSTARFKESPVGFNLGGALTFRLTRLFGIAFQARFSRATVSLQRADAEAFEFNAGGFRIGGGVRLSF